MKAPAAFAFLLLLASAALPAEAPGDKPEKAPQPTKTRVKPLALERQLIQYLAKSKKADPEEAQRLTEKAGYLVRAAGEGYALGAARPDRRPEDEHALALEQALRVLTAMPLREMAYLVDQLYRREKVRIGVPPDSEAKPASKLKFCLSSIQSEIEARKKRIEELRSGARISVRGLVRGVDASPKARIEELERAVERLQAYEKKFEELVGELERSEGLKGDVEKLAQPESRRFQASELSRQVERFGKSSERVQSAEGVGTHQVRIRVGPKVRAEIEAELEKRAGTPKREDKGKTRFVKTDLSFLPTYWPDSVEGRARGDFRITEYLSDGDVFLSVFDSIGVYYRVVVFEWKGALYVLVPSAPLEVHAQGACRSQPSELRLGLSPQMG